MQQEALILVQEGTIVLVQYHCVLVHRGDIMFDELVLARIGGRLKTCVGTDSWVTIDLLRLKMFRNSNTTRNEKVPHG